MLLPVASVAVITTGVVVFDANAVPAAGTEVTVGEASHKSVAVYEGTVKRHGGFETYVESCALIVGGRLSEVQSMVKPEVQLPLTEPLHIGVGVDEATNVLIVEGAMLYVGLAPAEIAELVRVQEDEGALI